MSYIPDYGQSGIGCSVPTYSTSRMLAEQIDALTKRVSVLENKPESPETAPPNKPVRLYIKGFVIEFEEGSGFAASSADYFNFDAGFFQFFLDGTPIATYSPGNISSIKGA